MTDLLEIKISDRTGFIQSLSKIGSEIQQLGDAFFESQHIDVESDDFYGYSWEEIAESELKLTEKDFDALTSLDFVRSSLDHDLMHMQEREPHSDVQYLHSLYEHVKALERISETIVELFENNRISEILNEMQSILNLYSATFGGVDNVIKFCEEMTRKAMDEWTGRT